LDSLESLPKELHDLPRLAFTEPNTPHQILREISLGVDILTVPFITAATDAGIALDFSFPAPPHIQRDHEAIPTLPLGIDMWLPEHAADLSPLVEGCKCYACTNHHRAYVQHLLNAKEMLAWVLLQIHNHHVVDLFFTGIRQSIANGTFENEVLDFERRYEPLLPEKTGQGPRVRGYQYKSEGPGEPKKNAAPFTMLENGKEKNAEGALMDVEVDAEDLEEQVFAEKEQ
jgi:queuine tRNA-ribosyltransferase